MHVPRPTNAFKHLRVSPLGSARILDSVTGGAAHSCTLQSPAMGVRIVLATPEDVTAPSSDYSSRHGSESSGSVFRPSTPRVAQRATAGHRRAWRLLGEEFLGTALI